MCAVKNAVGKYNALLSVLSRHCKASESRFVLWSQRFTYMSVLTSQAAW